MVRKKRTDLTVAGVAHQTESAPATAPQGGRGVQQGPASPQGGRGGYQGPPAQQGGGGGYPSPPAQQDGGGRGLVPPQSQQAGRGGYQGPPQERGGQPQGYQGRGQQQPRGPQPQLSRSDGGHVGLYPDLHQATQVPVKKTIQSTSIQPQEKQQASLKLSSEEEWPKLSSAALGKRKKKRIEEAKARQEPVEPNMQIEVHQSGSSRIRFAMDDAWNVAERPSDKEDEEKMLVHKDIAVLAGLPPFNERINPYYIRERVLEPSLCILLDMEIMACDLGTITPVRFESCEPPYDLICTDGAFTPDIRASYGAVARRRTGECDGVRVGFTQDLVPCNIVHELIGAKHGLILGDALKMGFFYLVLDCQTAADLIEELIESFKSSCQHEAAQITSTDLTEFPTNSDGRSSTLRITHLNTPDVGTIPDIKASLQDSPNVGPASVQDSEAWKDFKSKSSLKRDKASVSAMASTKKQQERIETAKKKELFEIKLLLYKHLTEWGKESIRIKCVFREGNYLADSLSHLVSEFTHGDAPFMHLFREGEGLYFNFDSFDYIRVRDMLSYYLRCYGRFSFLEARDEHFRGEGYNIGKQQASSSRQKGTVCSPNLDIYICNLPIWVNRYHLRVWFKECGTVHKAKVMEDAYTGESRQFGFITMSSADEVKAAVDRFNGSEIGGRKLTVRSGPPPPKESPYRCFVANLPWGVSHSELAGHFDRDGDVLDAKVVYDETGVSKGFGFVIYGSAKEVQNAVHCFNGTPLWGRTLRVEVAEARQGP